MPKFTTEIFRGRRFGMPVLGRSLALDKAQGAEWLSRTRVPRLREATQQQRDATKAVDRGPEATLTCSRRLTKIATRLAAKRRLRTNTLTLRGKCAMNTIILGGSGFLGPQILARYPEVISVGRTRPATAKHHLDCPTLDHLPQVLKQVDFDKVIMMIGSSNHHQLNGANLLAIEKNVLPLKKVLACMRPFRIQKIISFTSILLYDRAQMTLPVDESQAISPYQNEYIFSKYLAEELTKLYPDVPSIVARMTNIYGPSTALGRPDVVNQLVEGLVFHKRASVLNTTPQRDFIYCPDAADAIIKLLDSELTGVVNLASGQMCSIGDIVTILERLSGIAIERLSGQATGHLQFVADISLLERATKWRPQYTLEQGLTETYREMVQMYG